MLEGGPAPILAKGSVQSLRQQPRRIYQRVVEAFNLSRFLSDEKIVNRLRMAGYRGQAPVVTYLAFLVLIPVLMLAISAFYAFAIVLKDQPLLLQLAVVLASGYAGSHLPPLYLSNKIKKRQLAIKRAWPDALDLMLICVESGMSIESALRKVSAELSASAPALSDELIVTTAELSYLQDRRMAFENLGRRTGLEGVRAVVTSLIQSEKYGTPLGQALRVLAQENRDMRMADAEKKAASLPPKLTVPMILFFLPVLFAVIITPTIIQYVMG
ncbi:type II secretion system F family protein [Rhabdonatronobacter sediminivivens]|uniref:type II secretion system F family protein n=1 Tax=Rhabdonatronobacter sediminivivens TaxID=2743469 RepID=UPI002E18CE2F